VEGQILQAIQSATLVLFLVDIREGVTPLDETIARLLRKESLDVIGVANKADTSKLSAGAGEFARLGFGEFLAVSAKHNVNRAVLMDLILKHLSHFEMEKPAEPVMKIALIGKRNAGKSTMINAMAGDERMIVSETPGTTRDSVDVRFEKDGQTIVAIDTAGLRKTKRMANDSIEFYSYVRATRSVRRADVVLLLIDATVPIGQVDKKIAKVIADEDKACVLVVNKWDLAKGQATTGDYAEYLTKTLSGLRYAPIAFTTATESRNIQSLLDLAAELFKQANTLVGTGKLNKAFETLKAARGGGVKLRKGKPRIYYATQIAVNPVTILMFVNKPELFDSAYKRFILGKLRELLSIDEVPIRLLVRSHREKREGRGRGRRESGGAGTRALRQGRR
jgi:GTP-binding protein